jgi:hypothetical protein
MGRGGYNRKHVNEMIARTEASIKRMGNQDAQHFCIAKEDADGSEAR